MAAGSGLLKAKGLDSSATPGSVIEAPELSKNLDGDINALQNFNNALLDGATPAEAYADHLTNVSKAAQDAARQSNGLPVDIDKYTNAQTAASMATKVSTGSMIAQSVASAALTGAISMGVTLAVNGLVMGLDYLAHAHERAVEAVDNANQAYAENETELNNASSSLAQIEERLNTLNSIQNPSLADKEETAELERQREELTAPCVPIENSVCANPNEWRRRCFLWQGNRLQNEQRKELIEMIVSIRSPVLRYV